MVFCTYQSLVLHLIIQVTIWKPNHSWNLETCSQNCISYVYHVTYRLLEQVSEITAFSSYMCLALDEQIIEICLKF
jgi:hypothetical protein